MYPHSLPPLQVQDLYLFPPLYKIDRFIAMNSDSLATWNVMIDIGFWSRLAKKKIEEYQLRADPQPLVARFRLSNRPEKLSILSIDAFSFTLGSEDQSGPVDFRVEGSFLNTNTIEEYNDFNLERKEEQLLGKQLERFRRLAEGENVPHLYEIFLLIFADLKKHTFTYQFFSTATPVTNYKVIKREAVANKFTDVAGMRKGISDHLKEISKEKVVPQVTVLNGEYKRCTIKEFIENEGQYLFVVIDSTNMPNKTGYHTLTILGFFACLLQEKRIKPQRLSALRLLLVKEYLIHNYPSEYMLSTSQLLTIDASSITIDHFSQRVKHKKGSQTIDLKSFMDEKTLAKEAVDLNIRLMKWRLLPSLDIERLQQTKCLLFGAGTLGCQLARNLIGWGIKNITFLDYSKVSYSNPVRQTLYEFQDTIKGGKPKAETAAQRLRKIYPEINANGYSISIPMPGHYVRTEEQITKAFQDLDVIQGLVKEHDVLFLLLDSREARWLPTVLANKYDKACITVGLGFDSFLIVRHGISPERYIPEKHGERLCCYFCNDIVTPQNTMKDRTLDQMCTVTKPGLSFISAAYAAELYVSLLHHPMQHHAPAHEDQQNLPTTDLGKLPHHLRGNLSDYETSIFYGKAFEQCVACSRFILEEYNNNREAFMLRVLNDPSFIHDVTGLKEELQKYNELQGGIVEILDEEFEFLNIGDAPSQSESGNTANSALTASTTASTK